MFEQIIVGVDGRPEGRAAAALARAVSPDAQIALVTAMHLERNPPRRLPSWERMVRDEATALLERERAAAGIDAELIAVPDLSPARALQDVAVERGADLIVVGSAHHTRIGRVLLGDVGRGVMRHAPCPVAVAPREYDRRRIAMIGVGYDGSAESRDALAAAHRLAADLGARVCVIVAGFVPRYATPYVYPHEWEIYKRDVESSCRVRLQRVLADLGDEAEGEVAFGLPAEELARASASLDLLVVGSRRWGPVRRVLLGSTSDRLVHEASCPVLVTPRPAADVERPDAVAAGVTHSLG